MEDPASQALLGPILLIVLLTLINAFLAGAEMAFVSSNPAKLKELADQGDKKAKKALLLLDDSDTFLSAIQVGITFGGFFNSASASQTFVSMLSPLFRGVQAAETIATIIVTIVISYITLVLGELYPKQLALQIPEQYARLSAGPITVIKTVFKPFIWLLTVSTNLLKKITPLDFTKKEEKLTREEMKALLSSSRNDGAIDMGEFNMIRGVLSLDTKIVREIMIPRVDTQMIDIEDSFEEIKEQVFSATHSRFPLYREDKDDIVGILHIKDFFLHLDELKEGKKQIEEIARPPLFVPESLHIDELITIFQSSRQHLALLLDEFGGFEGIVSLEDLIEEIVGEIEDEHDVMPGQGVLTLSENEFIIPGNMSVYDFNTEFQVELESRDSDTMAGLFIEAIGRFDALEEEALETDELILRAEEVEEHRVLSLRVKLKPKPDPEEEE